MLTDDLRSNSYRDRRICERVGPAARRGGPARRHPRVVLARVATLVAGGPAPRARAHGGRGHAAPGRASTRRRRRALAGRGAHRRADPQPRCRELPPAGAEAHDCGSGRRCRGARRGARHRRDPRQDAEPGDRLRGHAHRHGRRGRSREPARPGRRGAGGDARLALADPAADQRRPRPVGRTVGAGARIGPRDPLRPQHRRAAARRPGPAPLADGHGRLRRAGPRRAGGAGACRARQRPTVAVLGAAGKSGTLSLAAARMAGAARTIGVVPIEAERALLEPTGLADAVVLADARSPLGLSAAVESAGGPADVTVVCVDVPGCEQPAILATAQGGTIIFFSMATNFAAAALGAEGLAADVRMIVGNGYVPGHADLALRSRARRAGRARPLRVAPRRGELAELAHEPAAASRRARPRRRAPGPVPGPQGRRAGRPDRAAPHDGLRRARHPAPRRSLRRRPRAGAVGQPPRHGGARRGGARARRHDARLRRPAAG